MSNNTIFSLKEEKGNKEILIEKKRRKRSPYFIRRE